MENRRLNSQNLSDLELIEGSVAGKIAFQELLYKRYFSFAMSICIRYTKNSNEAMEIVNDSYMKVLENLVSYNQSKPFKPWYAKILVNTAIDSYRKRVSSSKLVLTDETFAENNDEHIDVEQTLSTEDILKLFGQLPEAYRITFNLYEVEGYSHEEIGQMLGISTSTSRSNLTRSKKILRELYSKMFYSTPTRHEAV